MAKHGASFEVTLGIRTEKPFSSSASYRLYCHPGSLRETSAVWLDTGSLHGLRSAKRGIDPHRVRRLAFPQLLRLFAPAERRSSSPNWSYEAQGSPENSLESVESRTDEIGRSPCFEEEDLYQI